MEYRDGCAVLKAEGDWELGGALDALRKAVDSCQRDRITKVLIDTREVNGPVPLLDRSDIGKTMAKTMTVADGPPMAFAIVCLPDRATPERFLELVATNRGGKVKVVTDLGEGLLWLQRNGSG
jgi:hypothetical protein